MYDVFDIFLDNETWHSQHPTDVKMFNQILSKIVGDADFSALDMKQHFEAKVGSSSVVFKDAIQDYFERADAIRDYVKAFQ